MKSVLSGSRIKCRNYAVCSILFADVPRPLSKEQAPGVIFMNETRLTQGR